MHHPTDRITHTTAFVTPVVKHCLEQNGEGVRGRSACTGGYKGVQAVFEVLWNLECPLELSQT